MLLARVRGTSDSPRQSGPVPVPDNRPRFRPVPSARFAVAHPAREHDASMPQMRGHHIGGSPTTESKESPAAFRRGIRHEENATDPISPTQARSSRRRFSAAKPQEHEAQVVPPCRIEPVIQNCEIKTAFLRFNLLPCNWHQKRIHVYPRKVGHNLVCLCSCACGRIAQFTSQDQKWLAVYDQLTGTICHSDARQFSGPKPQGGKAKNRDAEKHCA